MGGQRDRETGRPGERQRQGHRFLLKETLSPCFHRGSKRWGPCPGLFSRQVRGGVPRPHLPEAPAAARWPLREPGMRSWGGGGWAAAAGAPSAPGARVATRMPDRPEMGAGHGPGGGGRGVWRGGGSDGAPRAEGTSSFQSPPPNFLLSPAWQGVCAASCPWNRQPVRSGPPHTRPSPPPSFLPPASAPPPTRAPRKVCIFPMRLARRALSQLLPVPCWRPPPPGPGGHTPGPGEHPHCCPQPGWKGETEPWREPGTCPGSMARGPEPGHRVGGKVCRLPEAL